MEMTKNEALEKIKQLEDYVQRLGEEVDYTVTNYRYIDFNETSKNIHFANGAVFESFTMGDGLVVDLKYIKGLRLTSDGTALKIYLKGSTEEVTMTDEELYDFLQ